MKLPPSAKLSAFTSGVMAASLASSIALNLSFYNGVLSSPTSSYCNGFYAGAINAIEGSATSKPVDIKRK